MFRKYFSYISGYQGFKELQYIDLLLLNLHKELQLARIQRTAIRRFTTWFTKNYNLKNGAIFFQLFKYVLRTVIILSWVDLYLICWLTSLRALFLWTSGNITSIVSITNTVIFSKQEVLRRRVARGSPGEDKCSWNSGKIKQL